MAFRRILAILLFVVGSVSAADNVKDGISMKLVVHVVPPRYPYELLHSGISGQGIVFGQVDYNTGNVTSVRMEKSTGNRALDRAALNAFHEWRFETGTVRQFRVPIKYEMRESGPRVMVGMDQAPGATDADVARRPRRDSGADPRGYTSADPYVHAVYERTDKVWVRTGYETNSVGGLYLVQKVGRKWQVVGNKHFWLH